ncbi:fungal-specific transcription factor domain-containing protein [Apiospora hydei]|uniref:Fungal-specific transcription factor domain-containing protein n=1 Tax=Apiospora hydei TaxID=1337664 RepID=A0ABR1WBH0_9PEZI
MNAGPRKRPVSSCIPCYTKKQKCDRQNPCNHCSKRRRADECTYDPYLDNTQVTGQALVPHDAPISNGAHRTEDRATVRVSPLSDAGSLSPSSSDGDLWPLVERYGYTESSHSNTLALVRQFSGEELGQRDGTSATLAGEDAGEVQRITNSMPSRRILDFLLQFFVSEISWIDHLIHPPWFLGQYQHWWAKKSALRVADVEFLVLVLRVVSYATHFLPSQYYTLDRIGGVSLNDIHKSCQSAANSLYKVVWRLEGRGSWVRVQHFTFLAMMHQTEGKMSDCWAALSCAIDTAQNDGMLRDETSPGRRLNEMHKEIRRRTYCHLYIWDSHLSRLYERVPLLPDLVPREGWTQMRLVYSTGKDTSSTEVGTEPEAPDDYAERLLQAHLATFWRQRGARSDAEFDVVAAEERYEQFCNEYLSTLPPCFALDPDHRWDDRCPRLVLLRHLLHISIFDSLCWNFRPVVSRKAQERNNLSLYKRVLLGCQKRALGVAALQVLKNVTSLHRLLGVSHTQFVGLITPAFEASVLLACLCLDPQFPGIDANGDADRPCDRRVAGTDPLRRSLAEVTRPACVKAVQDSLHRLRMSAEVSSVADAGAEALGRLVAKMATAGTSAGVSAKDDLQRDAQDGAEGPQFPDYLPALDNTQLSHWSFFGSGMRGMTGPVAPIVDSNDEYQPGHDAFWNSFIP